MLRGGQPLPQQPGHGHRHQRPAWPRGQQVLGPHDWQAGRGLTRNPPPWAPDLENVYPFRVRVMDAIPCFSTDVDEQRKGPQLRRCLGGVARDLIREVNVHIQLDGAPLPSSIHLPTLLHLNHGSSHSNIIVWFAVSHILDRPSGVIYAFPRRPRPARARRRAAAAN